MKKFRYILILFICLFIVCGCTEKKENDDSKTTEIVADYELDKSFNFMDFEVTVKSNVSILTIKRELSADNNRKVVRVPVTVRNTGNKKNHISMFYYKFFDTNEMELSSKGSYYNDSLDYAKDLNPGDKYDKFFYISYYGPGKYIIEFNNFSKKFKVIVNVDK